LPLQQCTQQRATLRGSKSDYTTGNELDECNEYGAVKNNTTHGTLVQKLTTLRLKKRPNFETV